MQDIHRDWHTTIICKSKRKERKKNYVLYITDGCKYIYFNDHSLNNIKMKIKNMVKKCKKKTLLQHV